MNPAPNRVRSAAAPAWPSLVKLRARVCSRLDAAKPIRTVAAIAAAAGGKPKVKVKAEAATPAAIGCTARLAAWAAMVGTISPGLAVAASIATRGMLQY